MFKHVKAIAQGNVALSGGIIHFDPDHDDALARERIIPEADVKKAESRGLIKVVGDASEEDYAAQEAGYPGRTREVVTDGVNQERLDAASADGADADEGTSAALGGGAAVTTMGVRNYSAGDGPEAVPSGGNPDEAPIPGKGDTGKSGASAAKETKAPAEKSDAK